MKMKMYEMTITELRAELTQLNSQYFANSCCYLIKDDTNETIFKIVCNLFSEALAKVYSRTNALCFRFDSSKCAFAKKYLKNYITKDRSDIVSDVSKRRFIECTVLYDNLEKFLSVLAKATDKAVDNSQLFAKQSKETAKQSKETVTVATKVAKQSKETAK